MDPEESSRRRWIRRRRSDPDIGLVISWPDGRTPLSAAEAELAHRLEAAGAQEGHRLTHAARPTLAALLSAEPQLQRVELDRERGGALLAFADGTLLRAAAARSAHPTLEWLAGRLHHWDPVYLAGARLSAEGGVLLRLVCGAFWPLEIGPLVPAAH